MAYSRSKTGLRLITVAGRELRSRFEPKTASSLWKLRGALSSGQSVCFELLIWKDHRLNFKDPSGKANFPESITPGFVAKAAEFALKNGWSPDSRAPGLEFVYNVEKCGTLTEKL